MFYKKGVFKNFVKIHKCLFYKVADLQPATLSKKETQAQMFT